MTEKTIQEKFNKCEIATTLGLLKSDVLTLELHFDKIKDMIKDDWAIFHVVRIEERIISLNKHIENLEKIR